MSYSGAVVAQSQPRALALTVETASRTTAASSAPTLPPLAEDARLGLAADPAPQVVSSQAAPPAPAAKCDTSQSQLFCVYTVEKDDTLSGIAAKFGLKGNPEEDVEPWELLVHSNKPDIASEDDLLQIGQKLRIPLENAVIHTVLSAQTLSDIAEQYDVPLAEILAVTANGISNADALAVGQELLVPNPKRFAAPAPPPPPPPSSGGGSGQPSVGARSSSGFIWPTTGPISSYFGPGHPLGIDIDLYASPNAAVGAAMAGTVTFAGGNACCSYGLYVVVEHGNGYRTLYAHLSKISVSVGQKVSQGALLGYGGRTGYATGNHLHFEVYLNDRVVNPLSYLP